MYSMRTSCTGGARLIQTVALLIALAAESSAQAAGGISVTQTAPGYVADATLAVTCTIVFDAARQVQSLLWMPALPSGWTLEGTATGDGEPAIDPDGNAVIFLAEDLSAKNPLVFQYLVTVPPGTTGEQVLGGILQYQLDGMPNPALISPEEIAVTDIDAAHAALGYLAGTPMTVTCAVSWPAGPELQSLLWRPLLPVGDWKLVGAAAVSPGVVPEIDPDGDAIVLLGDLGANPLEFQYTVLVPPGVTGEQELGGEIEYQLTGMPNPVRARAEPDPLILRPLHTLAIVSPYGAPLPAVGIYTNFYGTCLTNEINAAVTVGSRDWGCAGWLLASNAPATGTGTNCVLTLTNNAVLSWIWVAPQVGDRAVTELETLAFQASVVYTNAGFEPLDLLYTLDATSQSAGMSMTSAGAFEWTPSEEQGDAQYTVTVKVTDNGAEPHWLTAAETFTITVVETNRPPVLEPIDDQLADEQSTLIFTATASDPDLPAQTLTFSLDQASLDAGMSIDSVSGAFTWSPTAGQAVAGPYAVTVTVTDNGANPAALSDSRNFSIGVVDSRATHASDGYLAGRTAEIRCTFEHPDDKILLSLLWRPLLQPGWTLVSASGQAAPEIDPIDGTIVFTGFADLNSPNPLTFSYVVNVPDGLTGPLEFRAEADYLLAGMANPRTIPVNPDPLILREMHTYEIVSVEGQCDPPVGIYTNWHGTNLSASIATPLTRGTRTFACTGWTLAETNLTPVAGSTTNVAWVLTNDVVLTWNWVGPLIAPSNELAAAMDEDGAWQTPTISASEPYRPALVGQLSWSLLVAPTGGTATVSGTGAAPSIDYAPAPDWYGSDSFVVQVADGLGGYDQATITVTVKPVNDPPVLAPIGAQQTDEFTPLTFTASATDVDLPPQNLTYSISGAPANATFDTATGLFSWTPEAGQAGTAGASYTVTVTVTDDGFSPDNQSDSETFTITLVPVRASHATTGYVPGELLAIDCRFDYPADRDLQSLLWRPELPEDWTLVGAEPVSGAVPEVDSDSEAIVLLGDLGANPLLFRYFVKVPETASGTNAIGGLIEYQLDGMSNPGKVRAQPDPLIIPMLLTLPDLVVADKVYDGLTNATVATYGDLAGIMDGHDVALVTTGVVAWFDTPDVGSNAVVVSGFVLAGVHAGWYYIGAQTNTATITPRVLTVGGVFTADDKVYDGTTNATIAFSALTLVGPVAGDDVALLPAAAFADAVVGTDKPVALAATTTLTGADAANYTLSLDGAPVAAADILFPDVTATQVCLIHFKAPSQGLCTISNALTYPAGATLASLTWKPELLYPGWTVYSVTGDGAPVTDGTNIVFTAPGTAGQPLVFSYTFAVPGGGFPTNILNAVVTFGFEGVTGTLSTPALPELLLKRYHSADYETYYSPINRVMIPDWKIDAYEAQRFRQYSQVALGEYCATEVSIAAPDGFMSGTKQGDRWHHTGDYETYISPINRPRVPDGKIDAYEAQRVQELSSSGVGTNLGRYHLVIDPNVSTVDGYDKGP